MLKYLVIILSNQSTSFCHYENSKGSNLQTISTENLKAAIKFGMKENLMIQFVYPDYELTTEYTNLIESIDHIKIKPIKNSGQDDIGIINNWSELSQPICSDTIVIRTSIQELMSNKEMLLKAMKKHNRVNIALTDIDSCEMELISDYRNWLINFAINDVKQFSREMGHIPQLNILSDRLILKNMNNCNAGVDSITIGSDGNLYICPAFYYNNHPNIGNIEDGIIFNNELLKYDRAPICRICDAWQCKRCVWLNQKQTHELNTPGKRQCLISHIEREASRLLLKTLRENGPYMPDVQIEQLDYNEPFEKLSI